MKIFSIVVASAIVSGIAMTSAQAMGRKEDPGYNTFIMKMADKDGDGKISKDEYMKMSASMAAKEFMMMDMNDDGEVSSEEFMMNISSR